jgi:cytochrome b
LQNLPRRFPAQELVSPRVLKASDNKPIQVKAWDLPTRLCKWALTLLVPLAWISNKYGAATPRWHIWNGYCVLVVVTFRLLWGFFGGKSARFSSFVRWPSAGFAYLRGKWRGEKPTYLGHNPLGACMVLTLLAALAIQAILGLYSADEDRLIIEGPLAKTVSDSSVDFAAHWHRLGFEIILVLISIHVTAVLAYDLLGRAGLIRAIITGKKPAADYRDMRHSEPASWWRALFCLVAAVVIVFGGIGLMGGNPFAPP